MVAKDSKRRKKKQKNFLSYQMTDCVYYAERGGVMREKIKGRQSENERMKAFCLFLSVSTNKNEIYVSDKSSCLCIHSRFLSLFLISKNENFFVVFFYYFLDSLAATMKETKIFLRFASSENLCDEVK